VPARGLPAAKLGGAAGLVSALPSMQGQRSARAGLHTEYINRDGRQASVAFCREHAGPIFIPIYPACFPGGHQPALVASPSGRCMASVFVVELPTPWRNVIGKTFESGRPLLARRPPPVQKLIPHGVLILLTGGAGRLDFTDDATAGKHHHTNHKDSTQNHLPPMKRRIESS